MQHTGDQPFANTKKFFDCITAFAILGSIILVIASMAGSAISLTTAFTIGTGSSLMMVAMNLSMGVLIDIAISARRIAEHSKQARDLEQAPNMGRCQVCRELTPKSALSGGICRSCSNPTPHDEQARALYGSNRPK
jgi:uncharacterized paraquat-inducible protein A